MNRLPVSEGCVRATSNNNNNNNSNHYHPPLPATHAGLAARHVVARIRSYNQRHSTFRLAQPRGLCLPRGSLLLCKPSRRAKLSQAGRWENKWWGTGYCSRAKPTHSWGSAQQSSKVRQTWWHPLAGRLIQLRMWSFGEWAAKQAASKVKAYFCPSAASWDVTDIETFYSVKSNRRQQQQRPLLSAETRKLSMKVFFFFFIIKQVNNPPWLLWKS